jgi:hypothetical protein
MSNPNPAFVIVPAPFGAYESVLTANESAAPINTSQVVNPANFGFYAFSTIGVSNSTVPPADYPAVGR